MKTVSGYCIKQW